MPRITGTRITVLRVDHRSRLSELFQVLRQSALVVFQEPLTFNLTQEQSAARGSAQGSRLVGGKIVEDFDSIRSVSPEGMQIDPGNPVKVVAPQKWQPPLTEFGQLLGGKGTRQKAWPLQISEGFCVAVDHCRDERFERRLRCPQSDRPRFGQLEPAR